MSILKFLWLVIRPASKIESAIGWWDVVNLLLLIAYPTPAIPPLPTILEGIPLIWYIGIPIILILIAGIKLQSRILNIEKAMKPCLEVGAVKPQQDAFGSATTDWVLEIRNVGIDLANKCHAKLEQITTEQESHRLDRFPTDRDLHWAGWAEGIEHYAILGQQSAKLGLIYFHTDQIDRITIAYRGDKKYRLIHDLSLVEEPILLLLNIASENRLPLYVIIRIDLVEMVKNLAFPVKVKPIFEIKYIGTHKRTLSEFTLPALPPISHTGDSPS